MRALSNTPVRRKPRRAFDYAAPVSAVINRPGEGERLQMGPNSLVLHAASEDTDGSFFMSETELAPRAQGPPLHVHERIHDMFFVLEGTLALQVEDDEIEATPGTFACVPPGVPHRFWNSTDAPVRFLNLNTPGGFEGYMRDLAAAAAEGRELTGAEIAEIASRYDFRPV